MPTNTFKVGEMINKRTRNSKTWLNFDGSYTTEIHMGDVHFDDENGNLQNINTDLYDEADFDLIEEPVAKEGVTRFQQSRKEAITAKSKGVINRDLFNFQGLKVPFDCHIPRNFMRGYTIGKGADKLTFRPVKASPSKGYLSNNDRSIITYQDVWNDADVELKVLDKGIKETITLKTDRAPFSFSFEVTGPLLDDLTAGQMKLSPAWLEDAEGMKRDVSQVVRRENGRVYVDLSADVTGLVYPIAIDPTVTIQPDETNSKDTWVRENQPDNNYGEASTLDVWYPDSATDYRGWPLIQFDLSTIPSDVVITDSQMELYMSLFGNDVYAWDVVMYKVTSSWNEMNVTWNTKPTHDNNVYDQVTLNKDLQLTYIPFNTKELVIEWVGGQSTNYGLYIQEYAKGSDFETAGFESSNSTNKPKLTVTYNEPPTAPTVTAPNGGETWNAEHTITWNAATDPDSTSLQYHIQLSTDNGATWKDIVALTTADATSYTYDFTNEAESSTCLIRIRAYDGTSYGAYDQSDGVFTIQHNAAPTAPTNLSPNGGVRDRAQVIRLSWTHNDPNASDPQSKFDLDWRMQGATTWNTVTQVTTNNYYDVPANTFAHGNVEWRVRTYDQEGLSSPYSETVVFLAGDKPANPTITNPLDGATVAVANPTVEWSSSGQTGYHLKVLDTADTLLWEKNATSTNKAQTVQYDLQNLTDYKIQLAIKNADGLWSDFVTLNISVSYTPPAQPVITLTEGEGYVNIDIENPSPSGTEPTVSHNDIYKLIDGSWVRIVNEFPTNKNYKDYAVPTGVSQQYKVRAIGDNGTVSDSAEAAQTITFRGVWLHDVLDADGTIHNFAMDGKGRTQSRTKNGNMMQFAGRKYPVYEYDDTKSRNVNVDLILTGNDYDSLESLFQSDLVCYRDGRGRIVFGVLVELPESDETGYQVASIQVIATDYSEVV